MELDPRLALRLRVCPRPKRFCWETWAETTAWSRALYPAPMLNIPVGFSLTLDVHIRQGFIGALLRLEVDLLEVAQPVQGHVAFLELGPAVEISLDHGEFAADDLVARLGVAGDVDPVEIDQLPLGDFVGHVDGLGLLLRFGAGGDVGVGVALVVADLGQIIHVLHDRFAIVEVLLFDLEFRQKVRPGDL